MLYSVVGGRLELLLCCLLLGLLAISLLQGLVLGLLISLAFGGSRLRFRCGSDKRVSHLISGGPGGIRTHDQQLRKLTSYPD